MIDNCGKRVFVLSSAVEFALRLLLGTADTL